MKRPKLKFRNDKECEAVAWARRTYGTRRAWEDALREKLDPSAFPSHISPRILRHWVHRPYGYDEMNNKRQLARLVYRRAAYFPDLDIKNQRFEPTPYALWLIQR